MIDLILLTVWLMLPAYLANVFALYLGGGKPIDGGRNFYDGKRILGDGKTFKGLINGSLCGIATGIIQLFLAPFFTGYFSSYIDPVFLSAVPFAALISMPVGALLGDAAKSFIKRRLGFKNGQMMPLADQLDMVFGAWAFTYLFASSWFTAAFSWPVIITALLISPLLHLGSNIIGYLIGKKKVPY